MTLPLDRALSLFDELDALCTMSRDLPRYRAELDAADELFTRVEPRAVARAFAELGKRAEPVSYRGVLAELERAGALARVFRDRDRATRWITDLFVHAQPSEGAVLELRMFRTKRALHVALLESAQAIEQNDDALLAARMRPVRGNYNDLLERSRERYATQAEAAE